MSRTKKEIEREKEILGYTPHGYGCRYPNEPCNCEVNNKSQVRTTHEGGCNYPHDPCCCGL